MELNNIVSASETVSTLPDRDCPFCLHAADSLDELQNHIATHLQRVALFALPRSTDLKDGSSLGDGASGQANVQDSRQDDMESVIWGDDDNTPLYSDRGGDGGTVMEREGSIHGLLPDLEKLSLEKERNITGADTTESTLSSTKAALVMAGTTESSLPAKKPIPTLEQSMDSLSLPDNPSTATIEGTEQSPPPYSPPKEVFIAVMGPTGTGKTSFISDATGEALNVGHGLDSCT